MGIISLEKASNLYWLGRYSERVYTTLRKFFTNYDSMIDLEDTAYIKYCEEMNIPNVYQSKEDFTYRYLYDTDLEDSVFSNLYRAYDNAIVLREEINSETLAYIQLAVDEMKKAKKSKAPLIELQTVIDYILAFWGCADDYIDDEDLRNMLKTGTKIERIDLYLRLRYDREEILREFVKLNYRLGRTSLCHSKKALIGLADCLVPEESGSLEPIPYREAIKAVERIITV
ncbi:MAG: alpha-E domain-containing protein [Lachnospiraceae bacterium]|nr:alpha-E domain-containing protein [Lachnospiraceae bacterium]